VVPAGELSRSALLCREKHATVRSSAPCRRRATRQRRSAHHSPPRPWRLRSRRTRRTARTSVCSGRCCTSTAPRGNLKHTAPGQPGSGRRPTRLTPPSTRPGLTALVLVAAVSAVVPAVAAQRPVDAHVVGALEPPGARCSRAKEGKSRPTLLLVL